MTPERINEEAEHFFEWPMGKRTNAVTLTSCLIFARTMVQMERDEWVKDTGWRPIKEAPKNYEWVIVLDNKGNVHPDYWLESFNQWAKEPHDAINTHFMPLPQPPEVA